jgi:hypothetical protein
MPFRLLLTLLTALLLAGSADAAVRAYDSSVENGTPGDFLNAATNLCPPVQTRPGTLRGHAILTDVGAGAVTLTDLSIETIFFGDLGPDQLSVTFGPGAFVFIDATTTTATAGHVSPATSSTDPGAVAVWGIVSGWSLTGLQFCISSPVGICDNAGFSHGTTAVPGLHSGTYDLGTWAFDSVGDYESVTTYIERTSNGGLQNIQYDLRGAFVGSALPALPLVGFGVLALSLAVIGGRSMMGRK